MGIHNPFTSKCRAHEGVAEVPREEVCPLLRHVDCAAILDGTGLEERVQPHMCLVVGEAFKSCVRSFVLADIDGKRKGREAHPDSVCGQWWGSLSELVLGMVHGGRERDVTWVCKPRAKVHACGLGTYVSRNSCKRKVHRQFG